MEIDTQGLKQAGENGVLQKRIRVRYEDGQEVSRQLEDSGIIREPKTKILSLRHQDRRPHAGYAQWSGRVLAQDQDVGDLV